MEITIIGYLLLPLGTIIGIFGSRTALLYLTVFFAPFTATAIVNLTNPSLGIQPAYFLGILLIARFIMDSMLKPQTVTKRQGKLLLGFIIFGLVGFVSILLIPMYGKVLVTRPSGNIEILKLSKENLTQYMYLAYVILLVIVIGLTNLKAEVFRRLLITFLISGVFVSLWGWMQVSSFYLGFTYPDFIFNNNSSFAQHSEQMLSFVRLKRMNSVAPEPSMLARFLLIPTFVSTYCIYNPGVILKGRTALILGIFFVLTMVATTSSTALIGLVGGMFILFVFIFIRRRIFVSSGKSEKKNLKGFLIFLGILTMFAILIFVALSLKFGVSSADAIGIMNILLFDKLETKSGEARLQGALDALKLFIYHPLFGVGWGSNRSYDLFTNLVSTTGIIGIIVFLIAHLILAKRMLSISRFFVREGRIEYSHYPFLLLFVVGVRLFGKFVSEPGITYLDYWILIGLMIACDRGFRDGVTAPAYDPLSGQTRLLGGGQAAEGPTILIK